MTGAGKSVRGRAARFARMLPAGPTNAARTPFVLLVVLLLGSGLITLLMLNAQLNQGSFQLSNLKKQTTELTDDEQALQQDVDGFSAPDALERRARELGMVPGGGPAFLNPDGTVRGVPSTAPAGPLAYRAPAPPAPAKSPSPAGSASAAPSASPSAAPSASASRPSKATPTATHPPSNTPAHRATHTERPAQTPGR